MKRTDFTKTVHKHLRRNLALYETRIKTGAALDKTNCGTIAGFLTKILHPMEPKRDPNEAWRLLALNSRDWAYGCYYDDVWGPQFEWVPLANLEPYAGEGDECFKRGARFGLPRMSRPQPCDGRKEVKAAQASR